MGWGAAQFETSRWLGGERVDADHLHYAIVMPNDKHCNLPHSCWTFDFFSHCYTCTTPLRRESAILDSRRLRTARGPRKHTQEQEPSGTRDRLSGRTLISSSSTIEQELSSNSLEHRVSFSRRNSRRERLRSKSSDRRSSSNVQEKTRLQQNRYKNRHPPAFRLS